jgi:periplasmic glucans biosynthesis protein
MPHSFHPRMSRRAVCAGLAAASLTSGARAQAPSPVPRAPTPEPPASPAPVSPADAAFDFSDVIEAAHRLAAMPYQPPPSPKPILSYDAQRDARFRPDRAFLANDGSKFRLELFPLGAPGTTPAAVNIVSGGVARPIAFSRDLFDFGPRISEPQRAQIDGFAGIRLRYPLNAPTYFDEVIAFLRASYFRFVGRGQRYGQSLRGLAIGAGDPSRPEEFPRFREFWVMQPAAQAESIDLMALLDSPSLAGAYRMTVRPGENTVIETTARLYARVDVGRLGLAPITSMYLTGESGPRIVDDYRLEVHDASGMLSRSTSNQWTWRPLRNPATAAVSQFATPISGFGLMQRLRNFSEYEDLQADYQLRPSYWVEPISGFDQGSVELVELPEKSETGDNIVAQWRPDAVLPAGQGRSWSFRVSARKADPDDLLLATAVHTLIVRPNANLSGAPPGAQRFFIDFAGATLEPFLDSPEDLTIVAETSEGQATAHIEAHPEAPKLRVTLDVVPNKGARATASVHLAWLGRPVSETWTFPVEG